MGITIVMLWREVAPLEAEVKKLRHETGQLWIEDTTKIHAIEVDTEEDLSWKWRVWLPTGCSYRIYSWGNRLSSNSFPPCGDFARSSGGCEYVITYRIKKDLRVGGWFGRCEVRGGINDHELIAGGAAHPWAENKNGMCLMREEGVRKQQKTFNPTQRAIIVYLRVGKGYHEDNSYKVAIPDPADGFAIWIDPEK